MTLGDFLMNLSRLQPQLIAPQLEAVKDEILWYLR
jgi:hypothetical protein